MPRHRNPRLSYAEIRGLGRAAEQLNVVGSLLQQTNWAGAGPCFMSVQQAYKEIAALYNRYESSLPELRGRRITGMPIAPDDEQGSTGQPVVKEPEKVR